MDGSYGSKWRMGILGLAMLASAPALADIQIKESGLGNGLASNKLTVPVYTGNIWTGFQTISVLDTTSGIATSFEAFCVDPYQFSSGSYTTYTIGDLDASFSSTVVDKIGKLYNYAYAGTLGTTPADDTNAAALQLALWEVIADSSANLYGGSVMGYAGQTNASLLAATQTLLDNYSSYSGPDVYSFTLYQSSSKQDFLVATTMPVPEPGTYAMLLSGIGLMGIIARRRRRDSHA